MILISTKLHPNIVGGVEKVVQQYAAVLKKRESICIVTFADTKKVRIERDHRTLVISLPRIIKYGSFSISLRYLNLFMRLGRKARLINIHIPFPIVLELCTLKFRKKTIITFHADIGSKGFFSKVFGYCQRRMLRFVKAVIFTSNYYSKKFSNLKNERIRVIPLWLDMAKEMPARPSNVELPEVYVLYLGRFGRYKGLDVLLKSIKHLNSVKIKFVIAGQGQFLPREFSHIENVTLIERYVSEAEKLFLLRNCLFFLFPSTDPGEAFGLMQLEAMREGKAIINTKLESGVPLVSRHNKTGITVNPNDPIELAGAIDKLFSDERLRSIYEKNAAERYEIEFSALRSQQKLYEMFDL